MSHTFHLPGVDDQTTEIHGLLASDGIRLIVTSGIGHFLGFTPVGVILVASIGVSLTEEARLIKLINMRHAIIRRNA